MESVVGLQAEVQRKRQEFTAAAAAVARSQTATQALRLKHSADVCTDGEEKGKGKNRRKQRRDARVARDQQQTDEEKKAEERSRVMLQQKAALYERLQGGVAVLEDDDLNNAFLVNFQKKIVDGVVKEQQKQAGGTAQAASAMQSQQQQPGQQEEQKSSATGNDDDWVEHTDALGRTRRCQRRDLPALLCADRFLRSGGEEEEETQNEAADDEEVAAAATAAERLRRRGEAEYEQRYREKQRNKWEQAELSNAAKSHLHYDDVMFDEARSHGVGFVRLSGDATARAEQQELLRDLHTTSAAAAQQHRMQQRRRERGMEQRLHKIRQRKRLKIGLPMIAGSDELKTPPPSDEEEETPAVVECTPAEAEDIPAKRAGAALRAWDVGKQIIGKFVEPADKDTDEFGTGIALKLNRNNEAELTQEAWVARQRKQREEEFAPPSSYKDSSVHGVKYYKDIEEDRLQRTYNNTCNDASNDDMIINECSDNYSSTPKTKYSDKRSATSSCFVSNEWREKRRGAEIAPPATFDYYTSSSSKSASTRQPDPMKKMETAINKGLEYYKKQNL